MTANNMSQGFWGKPTSTIDWCEQNYTISFYIAEFWNACSSLVITFVGLLGLYYSIIAGLERRFYIACIATCVVGLGSFTFHATLLFEYQLMDELPMVWGLLGWWFIWIEMNYTARARFRYLPHILFIYGLFWTVIHSYFGFTTLFQVHFGCMVAVGLYYLGSAMQSTKEKAVKFLGYAYVGLLVIAFTGWLIDMHFCPHLNPNPQLHAWWHVLMGVGSHFGLIAAIIVRQQALKKGYALKRSPILGLPYVAIVSKP